MNKARLIEKRQRWPRLWNQSGDPANGNGQVKRRAILSTLAAFLFSRASDEVIFQEQREHDEDVTELMGG